MTVNRMSCIGDSGPVDMRDVPLPLTASSWLLVWISDSLNFPSRGMMYSTSSCWSQISWSHLLSKGKKCLQWVWSIQQGFGKDISYVELQELSNLTWYGGRMGCAVLGEMFWNTRVGWQECRSSKLCKEFRACWRKILLRFISWH